MTMKGIAARPTMVGIHLYEGGMLVIAFDAILRFKAYWVNLHSRLMVNPGIMTEANACQISVSADVWRTRVIRSLLVG